MFKTLLKPLAVSLSVFVLLKCECGFGQRNLATPLLLALAATESWQETQPAGRPCVRYEGFSQRHQSAPSGVSAEPQRVRARRTAASLLAEFRGVE
ncbi:hypothetical protein AOLI_G00260930 [Acnodon oligacanthus]